jgi:hypothetical protein
VHPVPAQASDDLLHVVPALDAQQSAAKELPQAKHWELKQVVFDSTQAFPAQHASLRWPQIGSPVLASPAAPAAPPLLCGVPPVAGAPPVAEAPPVAGAPPVPAAPPFPWAPPVPPLEPPALESGTAASPPAFEPAIALPPLACVPPLLAPPLPRPPVPSSPPVAGAASDAASVILAGSSSLHETIAAPVTVIKAMTPVGVLQLRFATPTILLCRCSIFAGRGSICAKPCYESADLADH